MQHWHTHTQRRYDLLTKHFEAETHLFQPLTLKYECGSGVFLSNWRLQGWTSQTSFRVNQLWPFLDQTQKKYDAGACLAWEGHPKQVKQRYILATQNLLVSRERSISKKVRLRQGASLGGAKSFGKNQVVLQVDAFDMLGHFWSLVSFGVCLENPKKAHPSAWSVQIRNYIFVFKQGSFKHTK